MADDDLGALFHHQLDPEANRMAEVQPRDAEAFNALWRRVLSDPAITARAILADDELAGQISCFVMEGHDAVGYWIAREHWGRGVASTALALLLEEVTKRPLVARVARSNVASIRVLERCGFVVERYEWSPGTERYLACEEAHLVLLARCVPTRA
ncbi:N-acetyltransferase [Deltaproteobacteria bacterium]|nr:N-acetyltransferase [Deltaproteobacteria bacterium]